MKMDIILALVEVRGDRLLGHPYHAAYPLLERRGLRAAWLCGRRWGHGKSR